MENAVYHRVVRELTELYGPFIPLNSSNGARRQGELTIYHSNLAPGNLCEIAFNREAIARLTASSIAEADIALRQLELSTGRPVQPDTRYRWPRVGLATEQDLPIVIDRLRELAS